MSKGRVSGRYDIPKSTLHDHLNLSTSFKFWKCRLGSTPHLEEPVGSVALYSDKRQDHLPKRQSSKAIQASMRIDSDKVLDVSSRIIYLASTGQIQLSKLPAARQGCKQTFAHWKGILVHF